MAAVELLALEGPVDGRRGTVLGEAFGPISPELALVDPELAARARALLPDPVEPARHPPRRVDPEPPPPPELSERAEPVEPPRPREPSEPPRHLRVPEAPGLHEVVEAPQSLAAPAPHGAAPIVAAAPPPSRRRLPPMPSVRVVAVAALLALAVGIAAWFGPARGDDELTGAPGDETLLEFSAPPSDPTLAPTAVAALERQVRSEPRSPLLREKLGGVYLRLGRWEDAERELRALVALAPTDGFAHFALGRALDEQGRHAEAKEHFALAEELGRDDPSAVPLSP